MNVGSVIENSNGASRGLVGIYFSKRAVMSVAERIVMYG
jgi:hypothetical protein